MIFQNHDKSSKLSPYVKSIFTISNDDVLSITNLPFFADGFPGLMYHNTPKGMKITPHTKPITELFLYGQTIEPIQIEVEGKYEIIVIQFYPFVVKRLFEIEPKTIVDDCLDLTTHKSIVKHDTLKTLSSNKNLEDKIRTIFSYLENLIEERNPILDQQVLIAIKHILASKGQLNLTDLVDELNINIRTFERRFLSDTGLNPKQFSKIIQFQNSLIQLSKKEHKLLSDIVYENGYADQSHFIKVFKSFTKITPKKFR